MRYYGMFLGRGFDSHLVHQVEEVNYEDSKNTSFKKACASQTIRS